MGTGGAFWEPVGAYGGPAVIVGIFIPTITFWPATSQEILTLPMGKVKGLDCVKAAITEARRHRSFADIAQRTKDTMARKKLTGALGKRPSHMDLGAAAMS